MKDEEELVVSKVFYKSQKNRCEWDGKAPAQSAQVLLIRISIAIAV